VWERVQKRRKQWETLLGNWKRGVGAGDGLRTRYLNLGKVALFLGGPPRPGSYSVGAVLYQAGCCGAQPHSIVFLCSYQPAKSFTPANSCGLRLPLLEPTGYECRGLVG